ncbi:MAG: hypothetical protein M3463_09150 [Verrucomicrobiota bacterium]|nr:hypothetical protein [Verrucomicrobiota bacterium]
MVTLTEHLTGKKPAKFTPRPLYIPEGDALIFYFKDDESYAERVDDLLTVYRSIKTKQMVGCEIKGVRCILKRLGDFGLSIKSGKIDMTLLFLGYLGYRCVEDKLLPPRTITELGKAFGTTKARFKAEDLVSA